MQTTMEDEETGSGEINDILESTSSIRMVAHIEGDTGGKKKKNLSPQVKVGHLQ